MPATVHDLATRVRVLIRHAEAHQSREWLEETAQGLVDALLELGEWRSGERDPRRLRSLALAQRVFRAHSAGTSIEELGERFGRSRSTIHRMIARCRKTSCDISVSA